MTGGSRPTPSPQRWTSIASTGVSSPRCASSATARERCAHILDRREAAALRRAADGGEPVQRTTVGFNVSGPSGRSMASGSISAGTSWRMTSSTRLDDRHLYGRPRVWRPRKLTSNPGSESARPSLPPAPARVLQDSRTWRGNGPPRRRFGKRRHVPRDSPQPDRRLGPETGRTHVGGPRRGGPVPGRRRRRPASVRGHADRRPDPATDLG